MGEKFLWDEIEGFEKCIGAGWPFESVELLGIERELENNDEEPDEMGGEGGLLDGVKVSTLWRDV